MSCFTRLVSTHSHRKIKKVYVLKLTKGKYYVGESNEVRHRIWTHVNLNGPAWTRKYPVVKRIPTITYKMDVFWELNETLEQMRIHGIDNVRGSMFSNITLTDNQCELATQLVCEKEKLCRKCGSHTHFESTCNQSEKTSWMTDFLSPHNRKTLCVVCDTPLSSDAQLNYCGEFCRQRHLFP